MTSFGKSCGNGYVPIEDLAECSRAAKYLVECTEWQKTTVQIDTDVTTCKTCIENPAYPGLPHGCSWVLRASHYGKTGGAWIVLYLYHRDEDDQGVTNERARSICKREQKGARNEVRKGMLLQLRPSFILFEAVLMTPTYNLL